MSLDSLPAVTNKCDFNVVGSYFLTPVFFSLLEFRALWLLSRSWVQTVLKQLQRKIPYIFLLWVDFISFLPLQNCWSLILVGISVSAGVAINQPEEEAAFAPLLEPSSCLQNVLITFIQRNFSCRLHLPDIPPAQSSAQGLDLPLFRVQECWIHQAPVTDSFSPTAALFHEEHFDPFSTMV